MEKTQAAAERQVRNAQIGYQVAAQLWAYEGQTLWSAFNAMLVANSIVIAAEGTSGILLSQPLIKFALPSFGLLLSLLWWALVDRGFTIHNYRVLATRKLELKLEPVETVSLGAVVSGGGRVCFTFPGETCPQSVKLSFPGRAFRGKRLATFVALLFALFHALVLVVTVRSCIS